MAQTIDWTATEKRAKRMTESALRYAILDCAKAAEALGEGPQFGKDASYYRDEASVYRLELDRRLGSWAECWLVPEPR